MLFKVLYRVKCGEGADGSGSLIGGGSAYVVSVMSSCKREVSVEGSGSLIGGGSVYVVSEVSS